MNQTTTTPTLTDDPDQATVAGDELTSQSADAKSPRRFRFGLVALALLVGASLATAAATYFFLYAPDQHSNADAEEKAMAAAASGTVALLSYSPDTLPEDLAAAKTHLTGEFLTYYTEFTDKVVAPAAQENSVDTQAQIVRSAVSDIDEDSATVLMFINQTTTSTDKPDPALTASSVRVTLSKDDGTWKISAFDPV